jgi:hypothetical protein
LITISRALAKTVRTLFVRTLHAHHSRAHHQAVELVGSESGLILRAQATSHAVEYRVPIAQPDCRLVLPLLLLKEVAGNNQDDVTLVPSSDGRVTANWLDGVVPKTRTLDSPQINAEVAFPGLPTEFANMPPEFLPNLVDAMSVTDQESSRYALGCVQLRGDGAIVATDGRQALKQSGFSFPFRGERLVPATSVFASKELATSERVQLGATEDHVVIRIGPWTFWLAIAKEARFARVDDIIPVSSQARCVVELAMEDRRFLADNLGRLYDEGERDHPVTVELNGHVVVRAKGSGDPRPTELELSRSRSLLGEGMFATNGRFLQRAAELGLPTLCTFDSNGALLCHDERRQYVWMGLDKSCIIPPSDAAVRITSRSAFAAPSSTSDQFRSITMRKRTVSAVTAPAHEETSSSLSSPATQPISDGGSSQQPSPIELAVQLHGTLREALAARRFKMNWRAMLVKLRAPIIGQHKMATQSEMAASMASSAKVARSRPRVVTKRGPPRLAKCEPSVRLPIASTWTSVNCCGSGSTSKMPPNCPSRRPVNSSTS